MPSRTGPGPIPSSTYRVQLGPNLDFRGLTALLPYLADLGIGAVYLSPILATRSGSTHGYDVVDHDLLNPELGTEEDVRNLAAALAAAGMGAIVDVVPNHMCIDDHRNWRWYDVLENGPSSMQAHFFDIDWDPPRDNFIDRVLLPVLGNQYGVVLENGEIRIEFAEGGFVAHYWDKKFPVAPRSWPVILEVALQNLRERLGEQHASVLEVESIVTAIGYLPLRSETEPERVRERQREKAVIRARLDRLANECAETAAALDAAVRTINGKAGDPHSFDLMEKLFEDQAYRLSYWRVAADEINYRRFFDINELAAIRVEDPAVFDAVHAKVLNCIRDGWVTGLRIDHPDGLSDPVQYFKDLQKACHAAWTQAQPGADAPEPEGLQFYVVAEKIMLGDERPRRTWAVHGTTGYSFMDDLGGVLVKTGSERELTRIYEEFTGETTPFSDLTYRCKRLIMRVSMSSELNVLARRLDRICQQHRHTRDFTLDSLRFALREIISCFPVYRTYIREDQTEVDAEDRRHIECAIQEAARRNPAVSTSVFDAIADILLLRFPDSITPEQAAERRLFIMRFQQLTGPVMAKGVEDTAFYRRYPLASLNEVGGDPDVFGLGVNAFHERIRDRARYWPHNMLATTTHDTKRSEDVRARLNVLSEIPAEWAAAIARWRGMNARHRSVVGRMAAPDRNAEYLLYQTLVGAWPLADERHEEFTARIQAYMEKALREAKVHTSWINPNAAYDEAVRRFIAAALDPGPDNEFLRDIRAFASRIALPGMLTSIVQVVLKLTCPGVPDIYQGNESWDLSLVDPDNRRPIDYPRLRAMLESLRGAQPASLLREAADGRLKMFVTKTLLQLRRAGETFFREARYVPLAAFGDQRDHVICFARTAAGRVLIVAAGRFFAGLNGPDGLPVGDEVWQESAVVLPSDIQGAQFRDVLTGAVVRPAVYRGRSLLPLSEAFAALPAAVLELV